MKNTIIDQLGNTDIYIIDQLMKRRINESDTLLDAGFGKGRNLQYFVKNNYSIYGIDQNPAYLPIILDQIKDWNPKYDKDRFIVGSVEEMPYPSNTFDFVFNVAVLHFAKSHEQFFKMLNELLRVVKPDGYLLFRMTSWHTFDLAEKTESGMITIEDGERYMLDIETLKSFVAEKGYRFADPIKTTNLYGLRTITTIVIQK